MSEEHGFLDGEEGGVPGKYLTFWRQPQAPPGERASDGRGRSHEDSTQRETVS